MTEAERALLLELARLVTRMWMPADDLRRLACAIVRVESERKV